MPRKPVKLFNDHSQAKRTQSQRKDFLAYALGGLGTITFFLSSRATPWMGYVGIIVVLTGIIVYGTGKFKSMVLYPISLLLAILFFVLNHYWGPNNTSAKPVIDISIGELTLQKRTPSASFPIKYENISQSSAQHFFNVTRLCVDSVSDRDSLDLLDIVLRHKQENVTLVKELTLTKIPFDTLSDYELNYLSKRTLFILGAIGYYDESSEYHLSYFCFQLLKNRMYKNYPKYNSQL